MKQAARRTPAGARARADDAGRATRRGPPPARDEVDQLLSNWQRERPDLDVSPLAVMSRLTRLARTLERERRAVFADHGLEGWGFDVLAALRRSGPPYELTPRDLLVQNLVTSGTMTNRIDRLEAAGLVSRRPQPEDRRSVLVHLSAAGRRRVDACMSALVGLEDELLRPLGRGEREELAGLLRVLLLHVRPGS